jgi:hypothetical protein
VAPLLCVVFAQALRARLLSVRAPGRTWPDMMQAVDLTWPRRVSSLSLRPRRWQARKTRPSAPRAQSKKSLKVAGPAGESEPFPTHC